MGQILTSIHGHLLGLDKNGVLVDQFGNPVGQKINTEGKVVYVSSVTGAANANGLSPDQAVTTIALAFDKVTANQGDVIVLLSNHNEIIGNETIALDVAGVYVLGIGSGDAQPQFNHNHASAKITVAAAGITLDNVRFSADVTTVGVALQIPADINFTTIRNCLFDTVTAGTDEFTNVIQMVDGNARTLIENNVIDMGIAAAVSGIHMDADTAYTTIRGNIIRGDYSTACIVGDTTLSTNLLIEKNLLVQGVGGDINTEPGIELLTGTTAIIRDNDIVCNLATMAASIVADTALLFRNYYNEDITGTGAVIGTASADD